MLLAGSAASVALGSAFAADKQARKDDDPGFNQPDKNADGQLSRTEYLRVMTAKDLHTLKEKAAGDDKKGSKASAGATKSK